MPKCKKTTILTYGAYVFNHKYFIINTFQLNDNYVKTVTLLVFNSLMKVLEGVTTMSSHTS